MSDIIEDEPIIPGSIREGVVFESEGWSKMGSGSQVEDTLIETVNIETTKRADKRGGDSDADDENEEWKVVMRRGKRLRRSTSCKTDYEGNNSSVEIYVTCKEILPKQFALARQLKANGITDITKVKYLNPYKVRLEFSSYLSAEKIVECEDFISKGWHFHKPMEVSYCYGVIKDVELDLSEEEILKNIVSPHNITILSVRRLNRRNRDEGGWLPSEAIRVCFKGSRLPPYVHVHDMSVKIEPYVQPTTQCSRCWRFGHSTKYCPSKNLICPKCSGHHVNCDTKDFKCVNCSGEHMALARICPIYLKEKRLRDIMSEYNCTYRKAMTIYVPPSPDPMEKYMEVSNIAQDTQNDSCILPNVIKTSAIIHKEPKTYANCLKPKPKTSSQPKQRRRKKSESEEWGLPIWSDNGQEKPTNTGETSSIEGGETESTHGRRKKVTFGELLNRIKEVIFIKEMGFQSKLQCVIKLCVEWLILVVVDNISDGVVLKSFIKLISGFE